MRRRGHPVKHSDAKQQERAAASARPRTGDLSPEEVEQITRHNTRSFKRIKIEERRAAKRTDLPDFLTQGRRP